MDGRGTKKIWVHIIHGYRLFSSIDMPFLGCVLCTGAHYARKKTVCMLPDRYLRRQLGRAVDCITVCLKEQGCCSGGHY